MTIRLVLNAHNRGRYTDGDLPYDDRSLASGYETETSGFGVAFNRHDVPNRRRHGRESPAVVTRWSQCCAAVILRLVVIPVEANRCVTFGYVADTYTRLQHVK